MKKVLLSLFLLLAIHLVTQPNIVSEKKNLIEHFGPSLSWSYEMQGKPTGKTSVTNPIISYYIKFTDGSESDYQLEMLVNTKKVSAEYDPSTGYFTYQAINLSNENEVVVNLYVFGQKEPYHSANWTFSIDQNPVNPFVNRNKTILSHVQDQSLAKINNYRTKLGLSKVKIEPTLHKSAQAHANYLETNPNHGHNEQLGTIGFTGENVWDRASYYGFYGMTGEGITYRKDNGFLGVTDLMDAPYHRLSVINPFYNVVGAGYNQNGDIVINYGSTLTNVKNEDYYIVSYPYNGQTDVKTSWFVAETPNPLRFWNIDREFVGYPVSFALFTKIDATLKLESTAFVNSNGKSIDHYLVYPGNDSEGKHHVFLIPKTPLSPGETYTASLKGSISGGIKTVSIDKKSTFTTTDHIDIGNISFMKNKNGVDILHVEWKSGEDPNAVIKLETENRTVLRLEKGYQYGSTELLKEGNYSLVITSPFYNETKNLPLRLVKQDNPAYNHDGNWVIERILPIEITSDYTPYNRKTHVNADKSWTIQFNTTIDLKHLDKDQIYILDQTGKHVPVIIERGDTADKVIIHPPKGGYNLNETYFLFVRNIYSTKGKQMIEPIYMEFVIN